MLTYEFAALLTPEQNVKALRWLELSRIVYNRGLYELEQWDRATGYYVKESDSPTGTAYYSNVCQLPWEYRKDPISDTWVPFTRILSDQSFWLIKDLPQIKVPQKAEKKGSWGWADGIGYSCAIGTDFNEPLLKTWQLQARGGLGQVAKGDYWDCLRNPELRADMLAFPYKLRAGVLTTLKTPWQEYLKSRMGVSDGPKRGKPRKKRRRDNITTIIHPNPKQAIKPDGNYLKGVPGLGVINVPGLARRWRNNEEILLIATFKLCLQPNGSWRAQLTGDIVRSRPVKATNKSVGIDPGLAAELSMSTGEQIAPNRYYRKRQKQRTKLQHQYQHKLTHNLILWLNQPDRITGDVRDIIRIKLKDADTLIGLKTEKDIVALIGGRRFQQLRFGIPQSKRVDALALAIKKIDRKVGKQRKAHDDKLTSRIVHNYGAIAIENGLQAEKLRGKAKPKEDENGGYSRNNSKAKSGLNKSLADASPGRKISLLKSKSARAGRKFKKVAAPYTSKACPVCAPTKGFEAWLKEEHLTSNLDGDRISRCSCGWQCDRDIHSGVNIELLSFGGDLSVQLSDNAERARRLSCLHSLEQEKNWKPRWAKDLKKKEWLEVRDAVVAGGVADTVAIPVMGVGLNDGGSRKMRVKHPRRLALGGVD